MDYLQVCAKSFEHLLNIKYHIILGRKGKLTELNILFAPTEFHHLIGIHKLHDLRLSRGNREKIFYQILDGQLSLADLKKSRYFPMIQKRMKPFEQIENFLDSNKLIFRYNQKLQSFSLIEAEYLLSTPYEKTDIYIFLDQLPEPDTFFCRSFFPKEGKDYTKGQAVYTLLKKRKNLAFNRKDHYTIRPSHTQRKTLKYRIYSTQFLSSSGSICSVTSRVSASIIPLCIVPLTAAPQAASSLKSARISSAPNMLLQIF